MASARDAQPPGTAAGAGETTGPAEDAGRADLAGMRRSARAGTPADVPSPLGTARWAEAGGTAGLTAARLRALEGLRWHWDEAYEISGHGRVRAGRAGGPRRPAPP